jgi:hypothetical protein
MSEKEKTIEDLAKERSVILNKIKQMQGEADNIAKKMKEKWGQLQSECELEVEEIHNERAKGKGTGKSRTSTESQKQSILKSLEDGKPKTRPEITECLESKGEKFYHYIFNGLLQSKQIVPSKVAGRKTTFTLATAPAVPATN